MKLVIVESPAKSKTIEKYLGGDYKVTSSMGHIRDLATTGQYGLGIDNEKDFIRDPCRRTDRLHPSVEYFCADRQLHPVRFL